MNPHCEGYIHLNSGNIVSLSNDHFLATLLNHHEPVLSKFRINHTINNIKYQLASASIVFFIHHETSSTMIHHLQPSLVHH